MNLANPEKTYYTYYSLQQWGKHGKSGFLGGGSSNMMAIAKKYLAYPEKNSLIQKKRITHTIAYKNGVSMENRGFWVGGARI